MKKLSLFLAISLAVSLLAGCAGTPVVYYSDCTCPTGSHTAVEDTVPETQPAAAVAGALKTGLSVVANVSESLDANESREGNAHYEVTMVAVLVDDDGIIRDCVIDGITAYVEFDTAGSIVTDLNTVTQTKNELGEAYNMKAWGNAIAEWNEQAAAFADYITGMTVEEVKGIAVDEITKPTDADLVSSVTIKIGAFIPAVEAAVANARHLGAQAGDTLKLAATTDISASTSADGENAGNAQLDVNAVALTLKGETVTSCSLDAVQAKVAFDAEGNITSELAGHVPTKNELGESYGMKAWGNAIAEWNEQAAAFAAYVTGKTAAEIAGIHVDETTKPTDAVLTASVTIAIGGFQTLIAKACQ